MLTPIDIDPRTFLKEHCALPALPEVVTQIQNKIHGGDVDFNEISELLSADPALVAQILKVVNSAYYALPREIVKVQVAIALIGINELSRMVLSLSIINALAVKDLRELHRFWSHSYYVAICTKHLAKRFNPYLSFDELWAPSILHDVGKLVYLKFLPDHYRALDDYRREKQCLFSEAESHFSVPPSSFFGTLLCERWRLPSQVRKACEYHSLKDLSILRETSPSMGFTRIICIGNLLAVLSTEELDSAIKEEIAAATQTELQCSEQKFLALMGDIYGLKSEVEAFVSQLQ
jgi:HD-like signal output (HDOD) protein